MDGDDLLSTGDDVSDAAAQFALLLFSNRAFMSKHQRSDRIPFVMSVLDSLVREAEGSDISIEMYRLLDDGKRNLRLADEADAVATAEDEWTLDDGFTNIDNSDDDDALDD